MAQNIPIGRTATNEKTGEKAVYTADGWKRYTRSATHESGARAFEIDGQWQSFGRQPQEHSAAPLAQAPAKPVGGLSQLGTPLADGYLLGAADEIAGGLAYGARATINKVRDMRGQPIQQTAAEARDNTTDLFRASLKDEQQSRPVLSTAGGIVGGVASPASRAAGRMGPLTGGAAIGSAYGFNSAEGGIQDRLPSAALGAGTGALGAKIGERLGAFLGARLSPVGRKFMQQQGDRQNRASEFGVKLTRGQATGDDIQISFEDAAAKGALGQGPREVLNPAFRDQATQLREAGRSLAGETVETLNDAGAVISAGVKRAEQSAKQAVDAAYAAAREFDAKLSAEFIPQLSRAAQGGMSEDVLAYFVQAGDEAAGRFPATASAMKSVQRLTSELVENTTANQRPVALDFARIENTRSLLTKLANDAVPEDARQVRRIKAALDGWLDNAVEDALFEGDPAFLQAYKRARSLRTEYGRRFAFLPEKVPGERVLAQIVARDADEVQTISYLLGRSKAGFTESSAKAASTLREVLGETSEEFQALREAAVMKLMAGENGLKQGRIGAQSLFRAWDDALNGRGAPVMRELFPDAKERATMQRYARVVKDLIPPEGAINYSATELTRRRLDAVMGTAPAPLRALLARANQLLMGVREDPATVRALQAVGQRPVRAQLPAPNTQAAGAIGAAQGSAGLLPPPPNRQ